MTSSVYEALLKQTVGYFQNTLQCIESVYTQFAIGKCRGFVGWLVVLGLAAL